MGSSIMFVVLNETVVAWLTLGVLYAETASPIVVNRIGSASF